MMDTVLFDLDGTLSDSVPLILKASRAAQEKMGIPWDEAKCRAQIGAVIKDICVDTAGDRWEDYLETYQYYYDTFYKTTLTTFPGMVELLERLKEKGFTLGVVTSRRRHGAEVALEHLQMRGFFSALVTANDCEYHKPHPAPALQALAQLGKKPEQAVFVGDTPYDVGCGLAAGCHTVGVAWGAGLLAELQEAKPHYIVHSVAELQAYLLQFALPLGQTAQGF